MLSGENDEGYLLLTVSPTWLFAKWSLGVTGTVGKILFKEIICGVEALIKDSIWAWESLLCLAAMERFQQFLS